MAAEKSIGDFYELFSKSLDLQQQMLQSLQRVESNLNSHLNQQARENEGSSDKQTTSFPVPVQSTNATAESTPSMIPRFDIIPPSSQIQPHINPTQDTTATHKENNNAASNRTYVVPEIVHLPAATARDSNATVVNSPIHLNLEQESQKDNVGMDLVTEKENPSYVRITNTSAEINAPRVVETNQPLKGDTYSPEPPITQLRTAAESPEQTKSGPYAVGNNLTTSITTALETHTSGIGDTIELPQEANVDIVRDIPTTPQGVVSGLFVRSSRVIERLYRLVAFLLSESAGRQVESAEKIVEAELTSLRSLAASVYACTVKYMAEQENTTIAKALKIHWSSIPKEIRQKHVLMLEEEALKQCQLNIGRCIDFWGSRSLLQAAAIKVTTVQSYENYLHKIEYRVNKENKRHGSDDEKLQKSTSHSDPFTSKTSAVASSSAPRINTRSAKATKPANKMLITKSRRPIAFRSTLNVEEPTTTSKYSAAAPRNNNNGSRHKSVDQATSSKASIVNISSISADDKLSSDYNTSAAAILPSNSKKTRTSASLGHSNFSLSNFKLPFIRIATKAAGNKGFSTKVPSLTTTAPKTPSLDDDAPTSSNATSTVAQPVPAKSSSSISLAKKPIRVPVVIPVIDDNDSDDDDDAFEESFLSLMEDKNRKRAYPDKVDYSSSSRKREKLENKEDE